jgi:hypothetical protein
MSDKMGRVCFLMMVESLLQNTEPLAQKYLHKPERESQSGLRSLRAH